MEGGHRSTCHPRQPKNALDKTTSTDSQIILQYLIISTLANSRRAQEYLPPQAEKNALDKTRSTGRQIILQYLIMSTLPNSRRA